MKVKYDAVDANSSGHGVRSFCFGAAIGATAAASIAFVAPLEFFNLCFLTSDFTVTRTQRSGGYGFLPPGRLLRGEKRLVMSAIVAMIHRA